MESSNRDEDILLKVVVVGDSAVGKSNFLSRYVHNYFNEDISSTLGVDLLSKRIQIREKTVNIQFWDTAGQERMRALANAYYKNANGIIVVYDITVKSSFKSLDFWIREVKKNTDESVKIIIVGNKTDLLAHRQVSTEEAKEYADSKGYFYAEVSAKVNYENKVSECVTTLASEIVTCLSTEKADELKSASRKRRENVKLVHESIIKNKEGAKSKCCEYI